MLKTLHGNGVPIVVRDGESPLHGKGGQVVNSKTKKGYGERPCEIQTKF